MKRLFILHPFLLAFYFVFRLFSHNIDEVIATDLIMPLAVVMGFVFISWRLFRFLTDRQKAGIIVSVFLFMFFSFGHLHNLINQIIIVRCRYLLPVYIGLFAYVAYIILKTKKRVDKFTYVLNFTAGFLIAFCVVNIISNGYGFNTDFQDKKVIKTADWAYGASALPNIYYIILDSYAGQGTLKEIYGYDNSEFINFLKKKGFYVTSNSRSNYPFTYLSLAATLNMEYVNYLTDMLGAESKNKAVPYEMIRNSKVIGAFKSMGYKFINICSGWGATDFNPYADKNIQLGITNGFSRMLIATSILSPFSNKIFYWDKRQMVLRTFSVISRQSNDSQPVFILAHIMSPHEPFVFDNDGGSIFESEYESIRKQRKYYISQLSFITKKIEDLISEIISKSSSRPIIILQSDHGPGLSFRDFYKDENQKNFAWHNPSERMMREKTGILNAYYVPQACEAVLYDSISPVNTFRVIFSRCFNSNCGLLKDNIYWVTPDQPYKFIDITNKVKDWKAL